VPDALDEQERAVVAFAAKAALAAADISGDDVEALRNHGLDDDEILDVVLATAARCFFSTVLDATGTRADAGFADRMTPELREALTVGRPLATA
jgi:alkylhydroperoxidase family enzyme